MRLLTANAALRGRLREATLLRRSAMYRAKSFMVLMVALFVFAGISSVEAQWVAAAHADRSRGSARFLRLPGRKQKEEILVA